MDSTLILAASMHARTHAFVLGSPGGYRVLGYRVYTYYRLRAFVRSRTVVFQQWGLLGRLALPILKESRRSPIRIGESFGAFLRGRGMSAYQLE